jgi:hypothetical protein
MASKNNNSAEASLARFTHPGTDAGIMFSQMSPWAERHAGIIRLLMMGVVGTDKQRATITRICSQITSARIGQPDFTAEFKLYHLTREKRCELSAESTKPHCVSLSSDSIKAQQKRISEIIYGSKSPVEKAELDPMDEDDDDDET